jgi:hypothetical protein
MGKSRVQTRVEPDTKSQIDEYAEDRDIGDAEALRRLIRSGLANEGYPVTATDGGTKPLLEQLASTRAVGSGLISLFGSAALWILSYTLVLNSMVPLAFAVFVLGAVFLISAAIIFVVAALAQLALAEPLRGLVGLATEEVPD